MLLCDISGSMEPYARAYLQFLACAAGSGPNAEAFVFATRLTRLTRALGVSQPGARDPARRRRRARLVERHPDRRRAEGVQRQARTSRHGPRRGDRDPLRRLGARRPEARGARDGAPRAPGAPDRVGQSAGRRRRLLRAVRRHGGRAAALRRARERPQLRTPSARSSRRSGRCRGSGTSPAVEAEEIEPWASATPVPGSSVGMPSGHGPSRGKTTPGWVTDE